MDAAIFDVSRFLTSFVFQRTVPLHSCRSKVRLNRLFCCEPGISCDNTQEVWSFVLFIKKSAPRVHLSLHLSLSLTYLMHVK